MKFILNEKEIKEINDTINKCRIKLNDERKIYDKNNKLCSLETDLNNLSIKNTERNLLYSISDLITEKLKLTKEEISIVNKIIIHNFKLDKIECELILKNMNENFEIINKEYEEMKENILDRIVRDIEIIKSKNNEENVDSFFI